MFVSQITKNNLFVSAFQEKLLSPSHSFSRYRNGICKIFHAPRTSHTSFTDINIMILACPYNSFYNIPYLKQHGSKGSISNYHVFTTVLFIMTMGSENMKNCA